MGSICSTEVSDESNTYTLRKVDTGSINLESYNPLIDQLVAERYKCGVKINAKVKGFLFRKKFKMIRFLTKMQSDGNKETSIDISELMPINYIFLIRVFEERLKQDEKLLKKIENLYDELNPNNLNPGILENKTYYNSSIMYSGQFNTNTFQSCGFGKQVKFKSSVHKEILDNYHSEENKNLDNTQELFDDKEPVKSISRVNEKDVLEVDIGLFINNKIAYGLRLFEPGNYYFGEFSENESLSIISGEGEYHCKNFTETSLKVKDEVTNKYLSLRYKGKFNNGLFDSLGKLELTSFLKEDQDALLDGISNINIISEKENTNIVECPDAKYDLRITYDGEFENGSITGKGAVRLENLKGTKNYITYIEGYFENGVLNGYSEVSFPLGHVFRGEVKNNAFNGKGVYIWNSIQNYNQVFDGEYNNNIKVNGKYSFKYDSLRSYTDNLSNNEVKIIIYDGTFLNNQPNGDAKLYINRLFKNEGVKKIKHEVSTEEEELMMKANFSNGRIQRLVKKNESNMAGFDDFEVVDRMIQGSLKKEVYLDTTTLKLLEIKTAVTTK